MIAAFFRTILRFHQNRRFSVDDGFVLFSCACLTGATVLFYLSISNTYFVELVLLNPATAKIPPDFLQEVLWYQRGSYSFLALSFTTIFSIKASFLCFFKRLIEGVDHMAIIWWVAVGTTAASWVLCVCAEFIACPYFGPVARKYLYYSTFHGML